MYFGNVVNRTKNKNGEFVVLRWNHKIEYGDLKNGQLMQRTFQRLADRDKTVIFTVTFGEDKGLNLTRKQFIVNGQWTDEDCILPWAFSDDVVTINID